MCCTLRACKFMSVVVKKDETHAAVLSGIAASSLLLHRHEFPLASLIHVYTLYCNYLESRCFSSSCSSSLWSGLLSDLHGSLDSLSLF